MILINYTIFPILNSIEEVNSVVHKNGVTIMTPKSDVALNEPRLARAQLTWFRLTCKTKTKQTSTIKERVGSTNDYLAKEKPVLFDI